jgi:CRP-like cAMP-binding protein
MPENLVEWMRTTGLRRSVRAGVTLAHRGARADSVLLVEHGSIFLERFEADGNLLPISVCGRGSLVGLSAAILDGPYELDATPRIDTEIVVVAAASIRALMGSPDHGPLVARALAAEARIFADRCAALRSKTVRHRVLSALAELCDGAGAYPVIVALPMQELAAIVAADLTHVCRVMRTLRDEGIVDYGKRRLAICSRIKDGVDAFD